MRKMFCAVCICAKLRMTVSTILIKIVSVLAWGLGRDRFPEKGPKESFGVKKDSIY